MADMTKKEAAKEISKKTAEAMALIRDCELLADQFGLDFSFDVTYGMGGYYMGKRSPNAEGIRDEDDDWYSSDDEGWQPSSQSC